MSSVLGSLMSRGIKAVGSKFASVLGKKVGGRLGTMGIKSVGNNLLSMGRKQAGKIGNQLKDQAINKGKEIAMDAGKAFVSRVGQKIKNSIEKGGTNINQIAEVAQKIAPQITGGFAGASNIANQSRHQLLRETASRKR